MRNLQHRTATADTPIPNTVVIAAAKNSASTLMLFASTGRMAMTISRMDSAHADPMAHSDPVKTAMRREPSASPAERGRWEELVDIETWCSWA